MALFGSLRNKAERVARIELDKELSKIHRKPYVEDEIIRLNTDEQLLGKGIDSEGVRLDSIGGGYAESTIQQKIADSLPIDRVTLFQEGDFYESFSVDVFAGGFEIVADTVKESQDLRDRWGENLLGLTAESIEDLQVLTTEELRHSFSRF